MPEADSPELIAESDRFLCSGDSRKPVRLIEGRRPNLFVSAQIAAATGDKAAYIKNRAFDKQHYKDMVVAYLEKFGEATRAELDALLLEKLSDALDGNQKKGVVTNLLQGMKKAGLISPDGSTRWAKCVYLSHPRKETFEVVLDRESGC